MKLPSLNHVISNTAKTITRFPFETLCAIIGTTCCHFLIENSGDRHVLAKLIMCSSLGLVVFLSSSLFFDTTGARSSKRFIVQPILLLLLIGYFFTFSYELTEIEWIQYFVLNICAHLAVAFAGFIRNGFDVNAFWEFNKRLFLRILTAAIYSGFLQGGLSLAIVALDKLFDLDIPGETYGHLFFTIGGIFNTLFFLAGVPQLTSDALETEYPKGLKAFTQFVLIPLVSIYLIILIAYESKIVLTMSLPYGWVSILILVYAIFGILSFLLIFPVSHLEDNLWMNKFNKWFYYFLVPLLVLLYWAITYRLSKYGFTPERYYVFVLALWLTFIVGYFLLKKSQNIKLIPMSLCITGLLTLYGPQSAQHVSKTSQINRFINYLHQNETTKLPEEDQREMSRVVDYVLDNYGSEFLVANAEHKLDTLSENSPGQYNHNVMEALGLRYFSQYRYIDNTGEYFNVWSPFHVYQVSDFDFMVELESYGEIDCDSCLLLRGKAYAIETTRNEGTLVLKIDSDKITVDVSAFANELKPVSGKKYKQAQLTQVVETDKYKLTLIYSNINGNLNNGTYAVDSYTGIIGITVKP